MLFLLGSHSSTAASLLGVWTLVCLAVREPEIMPLPFDFSVFSKTDHNLSVQPWEGEEKLVLFFTTM